MSTHRIEMRSANYGLVNDADVSNDVSLAIFRNMCKIRYFELELIEAVKKGRVKYQVYLSLGQETIGATLSLILREYQIFTQHRCHGTYLAFGGSPEKLRDELLGLETGTSRGRAGSNCIQCHEDLDGGGKVTMYGHHGLIGENVPLAVGAALGNGRSTVCFFGDGAAEEDYVFSAMGYAVTHKLPILFVCEDNNLSILTPVNVRRSWSLTSVSKALGMSAVDIADDPWTILYHAKNMVGDLPGFMNIFTCRANWHVGIGIDGPPEWNRWNITENKLRKLGLGIEIEKIEEEIRSYMKELWADR